MPEELEALDKLLESSCPEITFLQYKKLLRLVKHDTRTENEYYGNSTNYATKTIALRDVYQFLKELYPQKTL